MLPKKAKMAFWRLCVGGTLIRTRAFCISGLSLVAKTFTRPWSISKTFSDALQLRKIDFSLLPIGFKDKIKFEKLSKGSSISSGTHYSSWECDFCFFTFKKVPKNMCFYRFTHITDDLQSVTSRILHSTADFRSIILQTIWFSAYYRQFSFSKKCKDF